jgi:hypothetical protein
MKMYYSKPGLVFISIVGMGLIYYAVHLSIDSIKAKKWPTTTGTVISSEVESKIKSNGKGTVYVPKIVYSYTIGSEKYTSDLVNSMYLATSNSNIAERKVKKYPVNSNVTVYYNPNKLKDSALEPGFKVGSNIFIFLFGVVLIVPPIIVLLSSRKKTDLGSFPIP